MRGEDRQQGPMFSYVSLDQRVPTNHPLRQLQPMVNEALAELSPRFEELYSRVGRPSIAPEKLLRALLLQVSYTVRSERLLMEQLDYNLLFRWLVGLGMAIRFGCRRSLPRIGTACWKERWPRPSSPGCWSRPARSVCCRASTSPWTAR